MESKKEKQLKRLEEFLKKDPSSRIETGQWNDVSPEFVGIIQKLKSLTKDHELSEDTDDHCSYEMLKNYADEFKEQRDQWQMPDHLMKCSLCLNSFEIILEGVTMPESEIIDSYVQKSLGKFKEKQTQKTAQGKKSKFKTLFAIAASICVLAIAYFAIFNVHAGNHIVIQTGQLFNQQNQRLSSDFMLEDGSMLKTKENTTFTVDKQAKCTMGKWSSIQITKNNSNQIVITLNNGRLSLSDLDETQVDLLIKTKYANVEMKDANLELICQQKAKLKKTAEDETYYQQFADNEKIYNQPVTAIAIHVTQGTVVIIRNNKKETLKAGDSRVMSDKNE